MVQWLIIGDTHGQDQIIEIDQWATRNKIAHIIQVGDFGIHWPGSECRIYRYFDKRQRRNGYQPNWYTCGGNHDNYTRLQLLRDRKMTLGPMVIYANGVYYVERGNIIMLDGHNIMFLGGAVSSDCGPNILGSPGRTLYPQWKKRKKGGPAWQEEAPTLEEVQHGVDQANLYKPDIWVTHDICTEGAPYSRGGDLNPLTNLWTDDTAQKLSGLYRAADVKPSTWFHGHYHRHYQQVHEQTNIVGCGIAHPYHRPAASGWLFDPNTKELTSWDEV
jgi:hypothetical protein